MKDKNEIDILKDELNSLEAKLIEQEHRPITLIWNFIKRKSKWKKDDKRRDAATKAIIWRLLFSPTTIAVASGGFLALISVFFLWEQNKLFKFQNNKFEQQNQLIEADRRSSQVFIMGEVLSDHSPIF